MITFLKSRLAPFKHPDFRYFFIAQTLSLAGQWSHDLARSWIILELMGKASALGLLLVATAVPSLIFILQGGVLVDRVNVKKIMMITKGILAGSALALALVSEYSQVEFWMLIVFGIIEGAVTGFDLPAYQALTVRLVPRHDFQQALALNSTNFQASRMLGPVIAGVLMAWHGPSAVFMFDAITYFVLIFILSKLNLLKVQRSIESLQLSPWESLKKGYGYIRHTPSIFPKVLQLFLAISFMVPLMSVIFRTYIQQKFNLSAEEFGYALSLPALGSTFGALSFTFLKPENPMKALLFGVPAATVGAILVTLAPTVSAASLLMAFTGFCVYLSLASITVSLHLGVDEDYRGRLGSVIGLGFSSLGPLMSFPLGAYADYIGFDTAIYSMVLSFFLGSLILAAIHHSPQMQVRS